VHYGQRIEAKTLVEELCRDEVFFRNSGGGVTLSGGECLIQGDFAVHVKGIEGDYYNVVGLPIGRVYQELKRML
jgi:septum formation protein